MNGAAAVKLAYESADTIDLLLSDVDMPHISGVLLGQILKKQRPELRVMLMSGGGQDGALLVLNYGWAFIAKPFVTVKLVEMINSVLHSPDRSQTSESGGEFDSRKDREEP